MARAGVFERIIVLIKGAGDLASGVAARLYRCGFTPVMTELPEPQAIRRPVCFSEAIYEGEATVEGIMARRVSSVPAALATLSSGVIPILVDPTAACRSELNPTVLVDGMMAKFNRATRINDARLVVALGPGFTASVDCDAVIETNRGHRLGRVIWQGSAQPDTRTPGEIGGIGAGRVLRAPADGFFEPTVSIGDSVVLDQTVARIGAHAVQASCDGVVRGLVRPGIYVSAGAKVADVDPRAVRQHCFTISDKSLAVAGGVLEAILSAPQLQSFYL